MESAAIYCRSSKDRAEVGLDIQRKELRDFAKGRGLKITAEFSDMEISGSLDETTRPGLKGLLAALRDPQRGWGTVLALDTSRIARDPMLGLFVTREAEKHGAQICYAKMPVDGGSAFGETMLDVVRAFDRLHARLSAEKGRGGLEANIAKGFRAGGRAPFGYKLEHHETGGVRDGKAVTKSKLVVDARASKKVKAFLEARAAGVARVEATKLARLTDKAVASLIAIERNALTYAGFTVWNQRRKHKPTREDERKTMLWRPRSEWVVTEEPTHDALITPAEAERVLAYHDGLAHRAPRTRRPDLFLLSGLMFTPEGVQWHGDSDSKAYRAGTKGKRVSAEWIEGHVIRRFTEDAADPAFLARTVAEAKRMADSIQADPQALDSDIKKLERQIGNLLDLAGEGDKTVLGRIRETEAKIGDLREQKVAWAERAALKKHLSEIKAEQVQSLLQLVGYEITHTVDPRDSMVPLGQEMDRDQFRSVLMTLVDRIELDPATRDFTLKYRLPLTGVKLASPRGFEPLLQP